MADAKLQAELEQSEAEIVRLRERMSMGLPTVHKDLSLISLIPKWSGSESAVPLEEFLAIVDSAARIGNWDQTDCLEIVALKLADPTKSFHNTCLELHARVKGLKNLRIDAGRSHKKLCARTVTLSHSASTGKMRRGCFWLVL